MIKITEERIIELHEPSDNSSVISAVKHLALSLGYTESQQALISSAASELSTNILKYAGSGRVFLRTLTADHRLGIEIEAVDSGPGIIDIEQAMVESYSTAGSLGLGLSSVKRIMDEFVIKSKLNNGTIVKTRKWKMGS